MNNAVSIDSGSFQPRPGDTATDLAAEIAALAPWSQNLRLPDGTETAPEQPPADQAVATWEQFRDFLPADLSHCTALEVGCNAGFYAIELARRGAHVTALESNPLHLRQAHWAIGRHELTDRIELYRGHLYDLARWRGHHDVVLFLNQLHQARYPVLALDVMTQLTQRCLVLQVPIASPGNGHSVPWWEPTDLTIETMIRSTGFEVMARPGAGLYICQRRPEETGRPRWADAEFVSATGSMPAGLNRYAHDVALTPAGIAPLTALNN